MHAMSSTCQEYCAHSAFSGLLANTLQHIVNKKVLHKCPLTAFNKDKKEKMPGFLLLFYFA